MPAVDIRYSDGSIAQSVQNPVTVAAALKGGARLIDYGAQLIGDGLSVNPADWVIYPDRGTSANPIPLAAFLLLPALTTAPVVDTLSTGTDPGLRMTAVDETALAEPVHRLIIETAPNRIDTGATYPGCSRDNQSACVPIQFSSLDEALQYAAEHGENPVIVPDGETAWQMVEGRIPIPSGGISPMMLGLGAVAVLALFMWRKK